MRLRLKDLLVTLQMQNKCAINLCATQNNAIPSNEVQVRWKVSHLCSERIGVSFICKYIARDRERINASITEHLIWLILRKPSTNSNNKLFSVSSDIFSNIQVKLFISDAITNIQCF